MGDTFGIPFSLEKLAGVYTEWGDYQRASEYLREVTRYREKEKGHYGRLVVTVLWGDLYFKKGQLDSAITFYKRVMQMPGASEQKYLLSYCFKQLRQIYEQRQDYKSAYEFLQQAMAYNDSMVNVETNRRIAELETEFESEKKDRQLAEFQLKLVKHNRLQIIMVGLIVILILGVFGLYKYQQLKRRQIQRESEIRNQLKQKEYEQKFTDEKLRIARELHDNIGSQLTFLIGSLDTIHYYDGGILKNRLTSLRDFTKKTLNELRNTVWAMKQESSGVEALLIRLNELKSQMNEYIPRISLEIRSEVNGAVSLSSEKMLNLFRISQEAVQNAVKHSDATRISINIKAENAKLYLSIWNNGSGFDLSKVTHGSGLAHMQQRCQACKGQFNIVSDQTGTEVQCVFPLD
jgi:signal transduction histidine kinase